MAFVVLYDANVLYPNVLRDLLIRIGLSGLVQAKWTDRILDEMIDALHRNRPDIPPDKLGELRRLIVSSIPDCLVRGYEGFADGLKLPDEGDRHVVAAAIYANAQVIVTTNLRDFPADVLSPFNIEAKSPDDFVLDQIGIDGRVVWACVQQIADSRAKPPETVNDVIRQLENAGLVEAMALLRAPESWDD
jgi:hypothetical protein